MPGSAIQDRPLHLGEEIAARVAPEAGSDRDPRRVAGPDIVETYRKHGVGPALQKFAAMTGLGTGQRPGQPGAPGAPPPPEMRETMAIMQQKMARMQPNVEYFLAHLALSIGNYVPDRDALRARSSLVVVAVGDESRWPRT
jgi:hypothetical protein